MNDIAHRTLGAGLALPVALAVALAMSLALAAPRPAAAAVGFMVTELSGAAEVDAGGNPDQGDPDGSGSATVFIDSERGDACVQIVVSNIEPATAAHIHEAPVGENGPVVITLPTPNAEGMSEGCVVADAALLEAIIANPENYYVNVHNAEYPAGAVRGQLAFGGECNLAVYVDGGQGQQDPTVTIGQTVVISGSFSPGTEVEFTITHDGEVVATETVPVVVENNRAEITLTLAAGDEGEWMVEAVDLRSGCETAVTMTVVAAAAQPTPTPTPSPSPAPLPDTATVPGPASSLAGMVGAIGVLAVLAVGVALVGLRLAVRRA